MKIKRTGSKEYGRYIKALICGDPGAGKTLVSSTWPNPLYASAEGGLMSIADRNIPFVDITGSDELLALKVSLDQPASVRESMFGFPVDTVVIDTIDEVQKILIRERLEETRKDSMQLQDWGALGEQMQAIIRGFRNLDMHVIFTCHIKETTDSETGRLYLKPGLQGAIGDQIPAYVDLALLLKATVTTQVVNNQPEKVIVRHFQTYPDAQHPWVKDRSGKLPHEVPVNFEDDYTRVDSLIFGAIDAIPASTESIVTQVGEQPIEATSKPAESTPVPSAPVAAKKPEATAAPFDTQSELAERAAAAAKRAEIRPVQAAPKAAPPAGVDPDTGEITTPKAKVCADCNGPIESDDQADLSRIRYRRELCKACHTVQKNKSK